MQQTISNTVQTSNKSIGSLFSNLNKTLKGKPQVVEFVIAGLLSRGHILLEDLPGLGKTTLAKALANSIGGSFSRIQCTPDLLPGDITGFSIFNQKNREFEFIKGPVFSDILLADEINRTTPRTQSALLEAMAERQVTVDNYKHILNPTFLVIATQNPVDHHGTYPLPEAQLDRFSMKLSIGYPDFKSESELLASEIGNFKDENLIEPCISLNELESFQNQVKNISVSENVRNYLVELAGSTRKHPQINLGLSPRGVLIWQRVSQAWAFLRQRNFVTPDDIQQVAQPVLSVRLSLAPENEALVIKQILESVSVPN